MLYTFLKDSAQFFRQHFIALTLITMGLGLVFELLFALLRGAFVDMPYAWPLLLMQWVGGVWATAAVVLYVRSSLNNQYLPPKDAITQALPWVLPLAGVQLLTGLAVGLGLLLIVPGIYFGVKLVLATFYLIDGREPIPDALRKAWIGSTGYGWIIFGGYALIYGLLLLLSQVIIGSLNLTAGYGPVNFIVALIFKPVGAFALVFGYRIYSEARKQPAKP
ncbi:hypothetical protein [Saccharospirillum impatiens]|uniref:hypothetical protein n=1 Tax=Saccharospirillum impatiens TaxID=169438 RepID=UPI000417BEE6|nr:hypothetical protein [Saccharospirillum impatiens]